MTDAATTVSASGLVADVMPYIGVAIGTIIVAISAVIAAEIKKYTGIQVDQNTIDKIDKYIADKAASAVAAAGDNLATKEINVHSPIVAELTDKVVKALPDEMASIGLTPDAVASKMTSAFGRLQAQMTQTPIPPLKDNAPTLKPANMP